MKSNVYVLTTEKKKNNKYFVGKTDKISKNIKNYPSTCAWTNNVKFTKIADILLNESDSIDKIVLQYMKNYGIDNVRGGSWQQKELSNAQEEEIKKHLNKMDVISSDSESKSSKKTENHMKSSLLLSPSGQEYGTFDDGTFKDWPCDICGKIFNTFVEAETHENNCVRNIPEKKNTTINFMNNIGSFISSFWNN